MIPKGTKRPEFSKEYHPGWKGNGASYSAKHMRLPKATICEVCERTDARWYEWANLNHRYGDKKEDWIQACRSCHKLYDYGNIKIRGLTIEERGATKVTFSLKGYWLGKTLSAGTRAKISMARKREYALGIRDRNRLAQIRWGTKCVEL